MQKVDSLGTFDAKTQRILACTNCRKKKIKCDGKSPKCSVCTRNSQQCLYVLSRRRGRPSRAGKEFERNLDSLPKLLPKSEAVTKLVASGDSNEIKTVPDIDNNKNSNYSKASNKKPKLSHTSSKEDINVLTYDKTPEINKSNDHVMYNSNKSDDRNGYNENGNHLQTASNIFRNSSEELIQYDNNYPNTRIEIKYESEPIQTYFTTYANKEFKSVSVEQNLSPMSEKSTPPRLYGVCEIANRFTKSFYPDSVMVPLIPAAIKSKIYNDPGIMLYFHYFNSQFPIIHYPTFREEYDDGTVPNFLIMAMKAVSRRYSKHPSVVLSDNLSTAGLDLASVASSLAEIAIQQDPNTWLIQTLLILSIYEFGLGKTTRAYDRRNSAIKIAYKLGINVLDSGKRERRQRSLITAETCRRLWWILLYSDRLFSLISNRSNIRPIIDESQFRVCLPRRMVQYAYPKQLQNDPEILTKTSKIDKEFGHFVDNEVVDWFSHISPLALIIGHILYQRQAAFRLFNNQVMGKPTPELLADPSWIGALCEFLRNLLVIDAEIRQWKSQLNVIQSESTDSVLIMSNYHRKIQLYGLIIYYQFLALYAYERIKKHISVLSSKCTPLLWLRKTVNSSWIEIANAIESMQILALDKYQSLSSETTGDSLLESDWEFCAPHVTYFFYLGCKACVGFYHWSIIYKNTDFPNQENGSRRSSNVPYTHPNTNISQMFNYTKSWADSCDPEFDTRIHEVSKQIDNFIDLINVCKKYWNERDYIDIIDNLMISPHLFRNVPDTIEVVVLEMENKLNFKSI
ncbi:hypothetical protein AYI70_g3059 [Smittium culicis]|uniref:Zn(2)-C6 fungal-type domain-containing protein n=1 Tax=Smittium culicis TaxID=133412 RepID=A0A1R1Y5Q5_9FUNG|nr:hypothetical protein AYI70_g4785 [Smittium culicis]OMJ22145.1 hypothetical protein AYI70_g3059 [Smittium culicis]